MSGDCVRLYINTHSFSCRAGVNHPLIPVYISPTHSLTGFRPKSRKSYMDFEDDVWVDEAKGTFQTYKTSNPSKVTELFREMFNANGDVYSLLLAFLDRAGRVRLQKESLPRMLLTEFNAWLGEHKERPKLVPGTSAGNCSHIAGYFVWWKFSYFLYFRTILCSTSLS